MTCEPLGLTYAVTHDTPPKQWPQQPVPGRGQSIPQKEWDAVMQLEAVLKYRQTKGLH